MEEEHRTPRREAPHAGCAPTAESPVEPHPGQQRPARPVKTKLLLHRRDKDSPFAANEKGPAPKCGARSRGGRRSEEELLELELAERLESRHERGEVGRGLVGGKRLGVAPRFADHEHLGARGALEQVVGDAALVGERRGDQLAGGLHQAVAVRRRGADEDIESDHTVLVLK